MTFCCAMRERFLLGIVAENKKVQVPTEAVDFMDFDAKTPDGRPILKIKFCPFCGKPVAGPVRVIGEEGA